MKYLFFSIYLVCTLTVFEAYSQTQGRSIFLGERTDENQYKVFHNNSIKYVDSDFLNNQESDLIKPYSTIEFISILDSLDLYFLSEGEEPYWKISIKGDSAVFDDYKTVHKYQIVYAFSKRDYIGTNLMFRSSDGMLYGIIQSEISAGHLPTDCSCMLWYTERSNSSYYTISFSVNNNMYNGCVRIGKDYYSE